MSLAQLFSSDRSSCTDDGLIYIRAAATFSDFHSDAIDVTSVTLKRFNADDVIRYFGDILEIF